MKLIDLDRLKPSNIAIFDMNLHNECVPMVRLSDLQALAPLEDVEPVEHGQWMEYHSKARGYGKIWYQHTCSPMLYESPYYHCPYCGAKMESKRQ